MNWTIWFKNCNNLLMICKLYYWGCYQLLSHSIQNRFLTFLLVSIANQYFNRKYTLLKHCYRCSYLRIASKISQLMKLLLNLISGWSYCQIYRVLACLTVKATFYCQLLVHHSCVLLFGLIQFLIQVCCQINLSVNYLYSIK